MTRLTLVPAAHTPPIGAYAPGVSVIVEPGAGLVFVSGQVASGPDGAVVGEGDAGVQAEFVFDRIAAVLAEAGARLDDLVSVTIFLTDMADFPAVSAVRNRRLGEARPASTLVEVSRLAVPGHRVEINGVAIVGAGRAER
jgi:enamine deaminase RidA (YjgF/YER057c/UK114 family)